MDNREREEKKQQIAQSLCQAVATQLSMAQSCFQDGGECLTLNASVAMVGVAACCTSLNNAKIGDHSIPTADHVLFSCLYISNAATFDSSGGLTMEFDIGNVIKTLEQFQDMTGRSFEPMMDKSLLDKVIDSRSACRVDGDMSKFMPN